MNLKQAARFSGEYKNGKPVFDNPEEIKQFFESAKGRFVCMFEKESEEITQRARGFYYGKLLPTVAKVSGHSIEEVDGIFHRTFLTINREKATEYVRSTANLSKEEYTNYIAQCVQRAAEHGIIVE